MNKLIIDAAKDKVFLMIINDDTSYNMSLENSKSNYEKLTLFINEFLKSKNLNLNTINKIYVNRGPGSFAGIRNSLSIVKAFNVAKNIDYYCYNLVDFINEKDLNHKNIPNLCKKYKIKKNLINPIYIS